jgi:hypothetical protein
MAPLATKELRNLVLGILNIVKAEDGFATKTKLLKLLYLSDIEAVRDTRQTLTGFAWVFYLYGPWTSEYDDLLNEMVSDDLIELQSGDRVDLDTVFVEPRARDNFDSIPIPPATWVAVRRLAKLWAGEPTGELLNYVYFSTEPMIHARRGEPIDFSSVASRAETPLYTRPKTCATSKELRTAQAKFRDARLPRQSPSEVFTVPTYDDVFSKAIQALDDESE